MTTAFALKIIVEVLVVIALCYGIYNEPKLIAWEERQCEKLKRKTDYDK